MTCLHLKSQDPAASRALLGCQSKLRIVERIGFLMCLHTHLQVTRQGARISWTLIFNIQIKPHIYISEFAATSPVIFLLKIADRDETRAAADSKLVLFGWPFHTASSTVDSEDDQGGLPCSLFQGPHVGVTVCSAGNYAVTFWSPVNTCRKKNLLGTHFHSSTWDGQKRKKSSAVITNASKLNNQWPEVSMERIQTIWMKALSINHTTSLNSCVFTCKGYQCKVEALRNHSNSTTKCQTT